MPKFTRAFIAGRMNKDVDERLLPKGEYVDALNVRVNSTEGGEVGSVENSKGNEKLITLKYEDNGTEYELSSSARTIGAYADDTNEIIYWFVHDPQFSRGTLGKLDLIVSYNAKLRSLTYHVISIDDGGGQKTTLNFDSEYLITGVNLIDNFLFFTDNLNPPRVIDITKSYGVPNNSNQDTIDAEEILVIKKPPIKAPTTELLIIDGDTYLEDRFISFAYRYQYDDGTYSATSPFSPPAFEPSAFDFSTDTNLNNGMKNRFNAVSIGYETGNSSVIGIDLLFKEADDNVIKVIKKINKDVEGVPDNTTQTFTFSSSKIFTILPDSEILRLYDNVPLLAKAQTILGNRLLYGNYVEGYDLLDSNGNDVRLDYSVSAQSEDVGIDVLDTNTIADDDYDIDGNVTVNDSTFVIDLTGEPLQQGDRLSIDITFERGNTSNSAGGGSSQAATGSTKVSFVFTLPTTYSSPGQLFLEDSAFIQAFGSVGKGPQGVGEIANYLPVPQSCEGDTFTDIFNCAVTDKLTTYNKIESFSLSSSVNRLVPVQCANVNGNDVGTTSSSPFFKVKLLAMNFDNGSNSFFEYYKITGISAIYEQASTSKSLHSDRNYEVGIVYSDEFARATTALVSRNNSVYIPCGMSDRRNYLRVTIPTTQIAPSWAKNYRFVIKPDKSGYETIYSNLYFTDPEDKAYTYFLLEGENANKVTEGDDLIIKADANGALEVCTSAKILEKKAQERGFLDGLSTTEDPDGGVPSGVYMKLKTENFSVADNDSYVDLGKVEVSTEKWLIERYGSQFPFLAYPLFKKSGEAIDLPQGSRISFNIVFERKGPQDGNNNCEKRIYTFQKSFTVPKDYDNFKLWWDDQNIEQYIDEGVQDVGLDGGDVKNVFDETIYPNIGNASDFIIGGVTTSQTTNKLLDNNTDLSNVPPGAVVLNTVTFETANVTGRGVIAITLDEDIMRSGDSYQIFTRLSAYNFMRTDLETNYWSFIETSNGLYLALTGTRSCGPNTKGRKSTISASIEIFRASEIIFETEPIDASPDIFFESSKVYDIQGGRHLGDGDEDIDQNFNTGQAAVIQTDFSNCFAFGNGAESYKIEDSIKGRTFTLGNRVTAVAAQDYKRAHRFADITYSGIYNDESNVNKLNEFNLGLVNFKVLEDSFGDVQILDGRLTDVLVLQSDKISYVLAGKNLLSDSTGGGSIASVPEVLGTQIARNEENGISFNPESYVHYENCRYFTDAKRGAVIKLEGSSSSSDRLVVISDYWMRTWFRDLFLDSFDTEKLGAFDPYMEEYVLASNDNQLPTEQEKVSCGLFKSFEVPPNSQVTFTVQYPQNIGLAPIQYFPQNSPAINFEVSALYNSITTSSGATTTSGSFNVDKNAISPATAEVTIDNNDLEDTLEITIGVGCPVPEELTVVKVVVTSNGDEGKTIYFDYFFEDSPYTGPAQSEQAIFKNQETPAVTKFSSSTGNQGKAAFPNDGSTVTVGVEKRATDTFTFDPAIHRFLYLRSNTVYTDSQSDVLSLVAAATNITPINTVTAGSVYNGEFTMPVTGNFLYLIWDLRTSSSVELTYNLSSEVTACCT